MGRAFWTVDREGLDMKLLFVFALSVLLVHAELEDIEVEEDDEDVPFQRSAAAIGSTDYQKEGKKEVKKPHFLSPYPGFPYPGQGPYPGQHPHGPPHHDGAYPPHHGPEYRPRQHDEDYDTVNHGDYKDDDYKPKHAAPVPSTPHHGPAYPPQHGPAYPPQHAPGYPYPPPPPYHHCPDVCDIDRYSKCTCVSP